MKPKFYCFDQSEVEMMNDAESTKSKHLIINFDLQAGSCTLDTDEFECTPSSELNKVMRSSAVAIL